MASYLMIHIHTEEIDSFVAEGGGRFHRNSYSVPADSVKFESWGVRIDLTSVGTAAGYKPPVRTVMLPWPRILRIDEMECKPPTQTTKPG